MSIRTEINSFDQINQATVDGDSFNLNFSHQRLSHNQLRYLADWMKGRDVERLDLSGTELDDGGAQIVAQAIKTTRALKTAYLSHNKIGDIGALALADALESSSITYCTMHHNRIGPIGGEALVKALAAGKNVFSIDLSSNRLGDKGAEKIALVLRENKGRIHSLRLTDNDIGLEGDRALAKYLPRSIDVTYRSESISSQIYFERHPFIALGLMIFLFPVFLLIVLCPCRFSEPIYGTREIRTAP